MKINLGARRSISVIMLVLGVILMVLAPAVWPGVLLFLLGLGLEVGGILLEQKIN